MERPESEREPRMDKQGGVVPRTVGEDEKERGKRRRDRSPSSSSSSSVDSSSGDSSDNSSDSEADRKHKKHKTKKDKHKKHKTKKDKKKKDKKSKKDTKKKKAKKNNKKEEKSNLNDQFGAYGFIRAAEKYHKQDEFRCWLSEHKNVDYGMLPERERNDLWETFVEDFNTCTLPHKKYYDLRAWEVADHNKKAQKHSSKLKKEMSKKDRAKPAERDEDIRKREEIEYRRQKQAAEHATELDAIALQHQAKEKDAMAKILAMAMAKKQT